LGVLLPGAFLFGLAVFASVVPFGDRPPVESTGVAIAALASKDDRIWVRANRPQVYYYAGLRPAHSYFTPQVIGAREGAEAQIFADLAPAPPAFIVVDEQEDFAPLLALLETRYDLLTTEATPTETLLSYRRRD
jgi:hypothetical protein